VATFDAIGEAGNSARGPGASATHPTAEAKHADALPSQQPRHMGGCNSVTPTSSSALDGRVGIVGDVPSFTHESAGGAEDKANTTDEHCDGHGEHNPSAKTADTGNDKTTSTAEFAVAQSALDVHASLEKARNDGRMNAMGGAPSYGHSNKPRNTDIHMYGKNTEHDIIISQ
jgi:hypothetical protein